MNRLLALYIIFKSINFALQRDCTIFAASALKSNVSGALEVLSEAVWNPQMKEDEVSFKFTSKLFPV